MKTLPPRVHNFEMQVRLLEKISSMLEVHTYLLEKIHDELSQSKRKEHYLTVKEACEFLKKSRSTVMRLVKSQQILAVKSDESKQSHYLITRESIDKFLRKNFG
ncbi:helix-turn-helix domain-containing protein [Candidatus Uabimicrobium sp. HlEnr_7]|uniref:helix-turn-helix domain-containing protein n=1 Tax=Candidatus Uabimicrobium helgolandensis TaxID=3095367 RepID=UPI0035568FD4